MATARGFIEITDDVGDTVHVRKSSITAYMAEKHQTLIYLADVDQPFLISGTPAQLTTKLNA